MMKNLLLVAAFGAATFGANAQCIDWVDPTPATGWNDFDALPCNGESIEITAFEVFKAEAYQAVGAVTGGVYTFSHCNGPGAGTWIPEYTIIAPSGDVETFGPGDGDGCSVTWTAQEDGIYLVVINEADNCGVDEAIGNGWPMFTTVSGGEDCSAGPVLVDGAESFEAGGLPECWSVVDNDGDGNNWVVTEIVAFDGLASIFSESFQNPDVILTPDNYLITPQLQLGTGDSLYYVIRALDANFPAENYDVLVSTTGTALSDFSNLVFNEVLTSADWEGRSIDLSDFDGEMVYIAFRHYDVSDQFAFAIDGIALPGVVQSCEPVSTDNLSSVEGKIYPNPTQDRLFVESSLQGASQIRVYDVVGRLVLENNANLNGTQVEVNVATLVNGIYTIQITNGTSLVTSKFQKL